MHDEPRASRSKCDERVDIPMPAELKVLVGMIARARGKQASSWIREVIEAKVQEEVDMARTLLASPLLRDGTPIRSRPDIEPD